MKNLTRLISNVGSIIVTGIFILIVMSTVIVVTQMLIEVLTGLNILKF